MSRPTSTEGLRRSIELALRLVARHHGIPALAVAVQIVPREPVGAPAIEVAALPLTAEEVSALLGEDWEAN